MDRPSHLKLWGDRPPSPPRFPPLLLVVIVVVAEEVVAGLGLVVARSINNHNNACHPRKMLPLRFEGYCMYFKVR